MIHDPAFTLPNFPRRGAPATDGPNSPRRGAPATDETPVTFAGVPVAAMEAIMALRCEQITRFGHTPEADLAAPANHLVKEVYRTAQMVREDHQFNVDPAIRQRHLVKLGALVLAALDRHMLEQETLRHD